ncbi:MAG: site-specific integrase [Acidobacteriales bacterium]|nr:site-specific integrase [Terriglobales bacterium]
MSVFQVGKYYHYNFILDGRRYKATTGKTSKQAAEKVERQVRMRLESGYSEVVQQEERAQGRKTVQEAADEFLEAYKAKHRSASFAEHALGHVARLLGSKLVLETTPGTVKKYQTDRLNEKAAPKTINEEVAFLLRLCGDQGELIRARLRREKCLKLKTPPSPGKAFSVEEQERMLAVALASTKAARIACERQARGEKPAKGDKQGGSPSIYPALVLALNCGMRDGEIKNLTWSQIDLGKGILTVGKSKTDAGTGRTIPLNKTVLAAVQDHTAWYRLRFGDLRPEWYVFPGGGRSPKNPTVPIKSMKTAWKSIRKKAVISGRWHDSRHTLITELAESGAGDETIMEIAGHVSRQMLSRYSHIRTEAKRNALATVERTRVAERERLAAEQEQVKASAAAD